MEQIIDSGRTAEHIYDALCTNALFVTVKVQNLEDSELA
jgi:hypothetical protein